MSFRAVVHTEAEGGYWADVPELPGCFTQGQTLDELYQNLTEAVACHLDVDNSAVRISLLEMVSDS
ncbi:MAG TPA: type II toxin-antitoxin system HicB family antitoxin [Thermoanaerobaculia bacterium]|jgi:predicted RNase H-like HicB family nuclease|nr:type II toxin-antitoxin system HicB family antitoxin [Thermoanaerobaculia bacterium]